MRRGGMLMSEKDGQSKLFLNDNKRFADAFNYFMYDGVQIIKSEDLQERNVEELLTVYGIDLNGILKGKTEQKLRDLLKYVVIKRHYGCYYVILGVENQSEIHYAMVVRNMISDALNYGSQVTEISKKHKCEKDTETSAEFLSGFTKDDKLIPVITLTIYWGADEWDGPRSLYEMFRESDSKEFSKFVPNYWLNLITPREIDDFNKFSTDLGAVLEIIKASNDRNEMSKVIRENPKLKSVDSDVIGVIRAFTGLNIKANQDGGKTDMCKAAEELERSCEAKGIIESYLDCGKSESEILAKVQEKLQVTCQEAKKYFDMFGKATV
jgi:hypothetical protein